MAVHTATVTLAARRQRISPPITIRARTRSRSTAALLCSGVGFAACREVRRSRAKTRSIPKRCWWRRCRPATCCGFLDFARRGGFRRRRLCNDAAAGEMGRDDRGRFAVTQVKLNPFISWGGGKAAEPEEMRELHHKAHEALFHRQLVPRRRRHRGR